MKPTCYVIAGLPGLGKSTIIREYLLPQLSKDAFVYSTDQLIEEYADRIGKTYNEVFNEKISDAHTQMDEWLSVVIQDQNDIVWDQTNLTKKKRMKIVEKMKNCGYRVELIYIMPPSGVDLKEWETRLLSRPGKEIPTEVLVDMCHRWEQPDNTEGFDNITIYNLYGEIV